MTAGAYRRASVASQPEPFTRDARTPSAPEFQRAVQRNVRRHVLRAIFRVATLLVLDVAAVTLGGAALVAIRQAAFYPHALAPLFGSVFVAGYLRQRHFDLALVIGLIATGNYGAGDRRRSPGRILGGVAFATGLQLWGSAWTSPLAITLARYVGTTILFSAVLVAVRLGLDSVLLRVYERRGTRVSRVVLVGDGADCADMRARSALTPSAGIEVTRVLVTDGTESHSSAGRSVDAIDFVIHQARADTIVICGYPGRPVVRRVMQAAMATECQVYSWNPNFEIMGAQPQLAWRGKQPLLEWRAPALRWWQMVLKRGLDIAVAGTCLIVFSPFILALAVVIALDSAGPPVFGQLRLGRFGRPFRCYKLRSMHVDAEQRLRADSALYEEYVRNDYKLPAERDRRVTRVGRWLRQTSLDELPQLWNVLVGTMSLVGPRPIVPEELRHYEMENPLLFLSLKPGITGAWQVNGRSSVPYPERTLVELEYVEKWSLLRDIAILVRTLPAVLARRGAF